MLPDGSAAQEVQKWATKHRQRLSRRPSGQLAAALYDYRMVQARSDTAARRVRKALAALAEAEGFAAVEAKAA